MGRFYQTSTPQFLDFVYKPPYDLMKDALATKQQGYDTAVNTTTALNGLLDIKHRDAEEENTNVTNIKNFYEQKIDDISARLQENPMEYNKLMPEITSLRRQIEKDRKEGDISKIEGTYNSLQAYQKSQEKNREKDPERYNAALNSADRKWAGNSLKSGIWSQEDIINNPDFNKLLKEQYDQMKADETKQGYEYIDGDWIRTVNGKTERLDKSKLEQAAFSKVMGQPEIQSWMKQSQKWGLGSYYDKEGSLISPFTKVYKGTQITDEEFQNLSPEQKKEVRQGLNNETSASALIAPAGFSSYTKTESDKKMRENPIASREDKQKHAEAMENLKHQHNLARDKAKFDNDLRAKLADDPDNPVLKEMLGIVADENVFVGTPALAFTPDELNTKAGTYANYYKKYNLKDPQGNSYSIDKTTGKAVYPTPEEKSAQTDLNTLFNDAAKKLNMSKQDYLDVVALEGGEQFGSKQVTKRMMGPDGKGMPTETLETTERFRRAADNKKKMLNHFKKNDENINSVMEGLAKNIEVTDLWYVPGETTPEGKFTNNLVNALFSSGVNYDLQTSDYTYYDEKGNNRKSTYTGKVDTAFGDGIDDKEAGKNVPLYLAKKFGGNPADYMKGIKIRRDGDKMVVQFTPKTNQPGSTFSGVDDSDLEGDASRTQTMIFDNSKSNIDSVFKENGVYDTQAGRNWASNSDPRTSTLRKKVNLGLGYLTQGGATHNISGIPVRNTGRGGYSVTVNGEEYDHIDVNGTEVPITNADQITEIMRIYSK